MSGDWIAINDVAIQRQPGQRVANLAYSIGDEEVGRVRCDGLVVATPAGSTGYNLANGGPVMAWGVEGFVVSFIAPHSLTARALVVAPGDRLAIHNLSREEAVDVEIDGRPVLELAPGAEIEASFVDGQGMLAQLPGANFYQRLREKFGRLATLPLKALDARPPIRRARVVDTGPCSTSSASRTCCCWNAPSCVSRPGLNVLTGETGAGKTLLAHALDLLLGGKARSGIVRDGAGEAYVEGVFAIPATLAGDERIPDGAEDLVLARRVWPDGRTRAYVCGRSATVADLRELGGRLLSFYGQHEHRKLMLTTAQLDALDAFCGPEQSRLRVGAAAAHERVRALEARLSELGGLAGARDRELDLVAFELREIEEVDPSEEEEAALIAERDRLRHHEDAAPGSRGRGAGARARGGGGRRRPARPSRRRARVRRGLRSRGARPAGRAPRGAALRRRGPGRRAPLLSGRNRERRAGAVARVRRGAAGSVRKAVPQARRRDRGGTRACRALSSS